VVCNPGTIVAPGAERIAEEFVALVDEYVETTYGHSV